MRFLLTEGTGCLISFHDAGALNHTPSSISTLVTWLGRDDREAINLYLNPRIRPHRGFRAVLRRESVVWVQAEARDDALLLRGIALYACK